MARIIKDFERAKQIYDSINNFEDIQWLFDYLDDVDDELKGMKSTAFFKAAYANQEDEESREAMKECLIISMAGLDHALEFPKLASRCDRKTAQEVTDELSSYEIFLESSSGHSYEGWKKEIEKL